jgi:hypothetical protein
LFVEFADVGGGNGGVATGFGLGFLVSASIGGIDKSGVVVAVAFSKAFGFTTYIGKLYEQIKQNTSTEHKHFIYADGQLIAINIKTDTTAGTPPIPDKTRYPGMGGVPAVVSVLMLMAMS